MSNMYNRFASRGYVQKNSPNQNCIDGRRVEDSRKPIYIVFILDKSGSMSGTSTVLNEKGEAVTISKIDQLNDGIKRAMKSLVAFEKSNPLYRLYYLIIQLDSYGQAIGEGFTPIGAREQEEIKFEADGCTELRASLNTLKRFINDKYLVDDRPERQGKAYNKAINVILMSDGWPTDTNGFKQSGPAYRNVIDEFNDYLKENDYFRSVDKYSMAVGDDACEDMLRYFADGDEDMGEDSHYYRVGECESIAYALDYLTRATLAHHTQRPIDAGDLDDSDDDASDDIYAGEDCDITEEQEEDYEEDSDYKEEEEEDSGIGSSGTENSASLTRYQINTIACKKEGCLECIQVCPHSAIEMKTGILEIADEKCSGCGACKAVCPRSAIEIKLAGNGKMNADIFDDM